MKLNDRSLQTLSAGSFGLNAPYDSQAHCLEEENQSLIFQLNVVKHELQAIKCFKHKYEAERSRTMTLHKNIDAKDNEIQKLRAELARALHLMEQMKLDSDARIEQIKQTNALEALQKEQDHHRDIRQLQHADKKSKEFNWVALKMNLRTTNRKLSLPSSTNTTELPSLGQLNDCSTWQRLHASLYLHFARLPDTSCHC